MAIATTASQVNVFGTNVAGQIVPFPYRFFQNSDLIVQTFNTLNGAVATLVLNTDYTVTGADNVAGGSVTMVNAVPTTTRITIVRDVPETQTVSFATGDRLPASTLERALDKLTMLVQEMSRQVAKSFRFSDVSDTQPPLTPLPSSVFGTDSNNQLSFTPTSSATGTPPFFLGAASAGAVPAFIPLPVIGTTRIEDDAVTTDKLANGAVTPIKIGGNPPSGQFNLGSSGGVVGWQLPSTQALQDGAVTTEKLADDSVTQAKIGLSAVGTTELANDAVTQAKIGPSAVGTTELANGSVTNSKMASNSVNTANLVNASVTAEKLAQSLALTAKVDLFTAAGTWTKPAGAKLVEVVAIGGGGGGGSGMRSSAAVNRFGGGGGGSGAYSRAMFPASILGATEPVQVGAGGIGGASATVNATNGNNGTNGGISGFGTSNQWCRAGGGGGGGGGTGTTGNGGGQSFGAWNGTTGGSSSVTTQSGAGGNNSLAPAGGGGGGGIPATPGTTGFRAGGNGGTMSVTGGLENTPAGGAGNPSGAGAAGTSPSAVSASAALSGNGAGGGGAGTTAGGAGGNGALYGGGGGGGGAASAGNSGKGGNGGNGIVAIYTYF